MCSADRGLQQLLLLGADSHKDDASSDSQRGQDVNQALQCSSRDRDQGVFVWGGTEACSISTV
jgi:hypothetical protein